MDFRFGSFAVCSAQRKSVKKAFFRGKQVEKPRFALTGHDLDHFSILNRSRWVPNLVDAQKRPKSRNSRFCRKSCAGTTNPKIAIFEVPELSHGKSKRAQILPAAFSVCFRLVAQILARKGQTAPRSGTSKMAILEFSLFGSKLSFLGFWPS